MKRIQSTKEINEMSYTDFVGFINQWNVLPGAHTTLSKWAIFSKMNKSSNILEIACSTGFSSRELGILTRCKGKAFDISKSSVKAAIYNKRAYAPNIKISYSVKDGYQFKSAQKFSHIVIGAALKFFPEPERMLKKCISLLKEEGIILASPFYIKSKIPKKLILEFKKVFGIQPTIESYKEIMKIYRNLEILFEERNSLIKETEEEISHYCHSTIKRACRLRNISDKNLYNTMFQRLYKIKIMSNKLRPYQGYTVLVLRYRSKVYPNRYIELF